MFKVVNDPLFLSPPPASIKLISYSFGVNEILCRYSASPCFVHGTADLIEFHWSNSQQFLKTIENQKSYT